MFELILFIVVVISGLILLTYKFVLPKRDENAPDPVLLDYAQSFFPVLLIVFLLRGFVVEPFRIPSGSMLPTLEIGDFILVNKFSYGVKIPIIHKEILDYADPVRGDVVVFRWPGDNKTSYIKRLVGLPGDRIEYKNRQLYINGKVVVSEHDGEYIPVAETIARDRFLQTIDTSEKIEGNKKMVQYSTLLDKRNGIRFNQTNAWVVPQGHYFMMGDNRDGSSDSRSWGFLPDENVVGKAFFIWFHFNKSNEEGWFNFSRIGTDIEPEQVSVQ